MSTEAPFQTLHDALVAARHELDELRTTLDGTRRLLDTATNELNDSREALQEASHSNNDLRERLDVTLHEYKRLRAESRAACQALAAALGIYPRASDADGNPDPTADYVTPPLTEVVASAVMQLHAYNTRALDMRAHINELEALADTATAAEEDAIQKLTPDRMVLALLKTAMGKYQPGHILLDAARELVEALSND